MFGLKLKLAVGVAAVSLLGGAASAATIDFGPTGWLDQEDDPRNTQWSVSITDENVGSGYDYRVTAMYVSGATGDIGAVGLAIDEVLTGASIDLVSALDASNTEVKNLITTVTCTGDPFIDGCSGGGGNLGGGGSGSNSAAGTLGLNFLADLGNGSSVGEIRKVIFDLDLSPDVTPLTEALFTGAALRIQTFDSVLDPKNDTSAKLFLNGGTLSCPEGERPDPITGICGGGNTGGEVPVPAGLPLMLTAIGIGAYMRKRARKSA